MNTTNPILQWFDHEHLPPDLRKVSSEFHGLAHKMAGLGHNAEVATCLRKLLEAKDAAVRAAILRRDPKLDPDA